MKKEDAEFHKKCQLYYNKIKDLVRKQKGAEVEGIVKEVENSILLWEEQIRMSRKRVNSLRALLAKAVMEEKRLIKTSKSRQKQQTADMEENKEK